MSMIMSPAPHIITKDSTQRLMINVLIALLPCAVAGVVFFGFSALLVLALSTCTAVLTEFIWQKAAHQKVRINDCSAAVTGLLLGLCITPAAPWWMVIIGSAFAIAVVKQLFGGLGDNFLNPALTARAVLLASWPAHMTTHYAVNYFADVTTSATPLMTGDGTLGQLLIGQIPGAIGETCKLAILIGLAWLLITRTIRWEIPCFTILGTFVMSWILGDDPVRAILTGGVLFGAVFMATDYVTSPMKRVAQIIYALLIGILIVIIRKYASYPEGVTYAIMLMNIVSPLLDRFVPGQRLYGHPKAQRKEAKAQ